MVNQMGAVTFAQLKERFPSVSEVTLRRDLQCLDDAQQLIRTHGGAKAIPHSLNFAYRSSIHQTEKSIIAAKAAKLIQPGGSVFITAGTTCIELAKCLPLFPLYVFTDGLGTACNLPLNPGTTVEILGGEVDLNIMRIGGLAVLEKLEDLHFNIAFLGTMGFHPQHGFSYLSEITAAVIRKVIEHSDTVVMLMDSSKVNYTFTPRNIPLEAIDILVTDDMLDPEIAEIIRSRGISVL